MAGSDHLVFNIDRETGRSRSRLADFLYPRPAKRGVGAIFKWWERRRLAYNAIVAAGGAITLTVGALGSLLFGNPITLGWLLTPVVPVLLAANACYTLGPIVESLAHKVWGREVLPVGPHLFRAGLIFSVGLTLVLPMILMAFFFVVRVVEAFI